VFVVEIGSYASSSYAVEGLVVVLAILEDSPCLAIRDLNKEASIASNPRLPGSLLSDLILGNILLAA
jgi:hypothetical protein